DLDVRPAGRFRARISAPPARARDVGPLAAGRLPHAVLPADAARLRSRRHRARAGSGWVSRLEGGGRLDAAAAGDPRPARLSPGPVADAGRLAFDARLRGRRRTLGAARHLLLALSRDARLAPDPL